MQSLYWSLMEWSFQRFYHECAWAYDTVASLVSRGLWYRWIEAALPYINSNGRILELGCGTGHMHNILSTRWPAGVGIDESLQMLKQTQIRLDADNRTATLARAVAHHLPFPDGMFDTVVATFPIFLLDGAPLREVRRVLAPDGRLVIVAAARSTRNDWYEHITRWLWQMSVKEYTDDFANNNPYQPLLEKAGFTYDMHCIAIERSIVIVLLANPVHG